MRYRLSKLAVLFPLSAHVGRFVKKEKMERGMSEERKQLHSSNLRTSPPLQPTIPPCRPGQPSREAGAWLGEEQRGTVAPGRSTVAGAQKSGSVDVEKSIFRLIQKKISVNFVLF